MECWGGTVMQIGVVESSTKVLGRELEFRVSNEGTQMFQPTS